MNRRNQLARERGFRNYAEQRRHDRNITNQIKLSDLPAKAQQQRHVALDALATARREGVSLEQASRREGITPQAVAWWTGDAVTRSGGTWQVTGADRLLRPMYIYSDGQRVHTTVRGSRIASDIGRYHSAVGHYLNTGDDSRLRRFRGVTIQGVELETDPDVIDDLARRGVFEFESIYRMVS